MFNSLSAPTTKCLTAVASAPTVCAATVQTPEPQHFDALATSFAGLSAAFTWGTIVLGLVALVVGASWGLLVKIWAKEMAAQVAKEYLDRETRSLIKDWVSQKGGDWFSDEGVKTLREMIPFSLPADSQGNQDVSDDIANAQDKDQP